MALLMQQDELIPKLIQYCELNPGELIGSVQGELDKLPGFRWGGSDVFHQEITGDFSCSGKEGSKSG